MGVQVTSGVHDISVDWLSGVVFESPVRSGLLPFFGKTGTETSPSKSKTLKRPDRTGEDWSMLVFCGSFWSKTGPRTGLGYLFIIYYK